MKEICNITAVLVLALTPVAGQTLSTTVRTQPLLLTGADPLPSVQGRIDHFGFDSKEGRLFLSTFGNNSVEVIDIGAGRVVRSIGGVPKPQGVAFAPELNKLFVGSDEGKL